MLMRQSLQSSLGQVYYRLGKSAKHLLPTMGQLEIPMLCKKALAFLEESLIAKLKTCSLLDCGEKTLVSFGLLSLSSAGFFLVSAVYLWQSRAMAMLGDLASGRADYTAALVARNIVRFDTEAQLGQGLV